MIVQGVTLSGVTVTATPEGSISSGLGVITYDQVPPPVVPGQTLQDNSATVNGSVGFTITQSNLTGVAIRGLTAENVTYFNNLGTGPQTFVLGDGSTYATITGNITQTPNGPGSILVIMFDQAVSYPATFNWPFSVQGAGGGGGSGTGDITYAQMPGPVVVNDQLIDPAGTVNGSTGFTFNTNNQAYLVVKALSAENQTHYNNLGVGSYIFTLGPGSTYPTVGAQIVQTPSSNPQGYMVLKFDENVSYPLTVNYPFGTS